MVIFDQKYTLIAFIVHNFPYIVVAPHRRGPIRMSGNQLETPVRGTHSKLIAAEIAAISDINLRFLQIRTHPATRGMQQLLGLTWLRWRGRRLGLRRCFLWLGSHGEEGE